MKSKKILASLLACAMISTTLLLAGCDNDKEPSPITDKPDAEQIINIIGYDYKTLDPALGSDAETFTTFTQVYEGLTKEVMKNGKVTTELAGAASITPNADKTVYTIKLRDSKWSDGKQVTAHDYEFSWKRQCDPKNASDYISFLDEIGVKGAAEFAAEKGSADGVGVKALDDKTLQVTLKQPTAYFESALAFKGLVPGRKDLADAQGDKYGTDFTKMVYNGPFVIADYQKGSKIVYKKNENYWNAKEVKLLNANAHIIEEPATMVKMFESKELDMTGATGDDLNKLKERAKSKEFGYFPSIDASAYYIYLNVQRDVLKNEKVRRALSLAFNRQQFLDVVFKRHVASNGAVPPEMTIGNKEYRKEVPEPLKALKEDPKKLMEEGLKELGITDPSKVKLLLLNGKSNAVRKASSEYIQKFYNDTFGINIEIKYTVDSPTYFTERTEGNFDICTGGWGADYVDINSFFATFLSDNQNNNGKYNNPEYDRLVKEAAKELDPAKRLANYRKAEELLIAKDAAVVPTYYQDINNFRHNYVKEMYIPKFGGYYDLAKVYLSGK